ncbi:hypothetical protein DKG71_26750 [Streptomyces sp. NEAU-S7GS2]|nr:hypothetical protein DKG71_26750 [Streptomyces sp. NEAU-S7GS2]
MVRGPAPAPPAPVRRHGTGPGVRAPAALGAAFARTPAPPSTGTRHDGCRFGPSLRMHIFAWTGPGRGAPQSAG